jgi:fermentation-respiration switch protein FrsA (DUF1100 family)
VVSTFWGFLGKVGQYAVKDQFRNIENIGEVTAPIFIVHGMKDELVPHQNSLDLYGTNI